MSQDEYITTDEAIALLGVSRTTLHTYVKQGRIQKYTRGVTRRVYYKRSEVEELGQIRPAEGGQGEIVK
jgi:excisionase family DNA binding protein